MTLPTPTGRAVSLMLSSAVPPERSIEAARRSESAGLSRLWITEDYYRKGAFSTAGALLASTDSLRIALGVTSVYARGLPVLAMESATVSRMFPGRFELGVGAGSLRALQQLGRVPDKLIGSLRHRLDGLRSLLAGETVDWQDEFETLTDSGLFHPSDSVPIWMAAEAPQMLRLAARLADGLILSSLSSPAYVRWAAAQYANEVEARQDELPIAVFAYVSLAADDETAYQRAAAYLAARLANSYGAAVLRNSEHGALFDSFVGQDPAQIALSLTPEIVGQYVPFGSTVPERFEQLFDAGVTEVAAAPIPHDGDLDLANAVETIAEISISLTRSNGDA